MPRDARIDAYIDGRAAFARPILAWLRERVHAACPQAGEAIKWGMPFFTIRNRPLANMAGFKAHVGFGFWERGANATGQEGDAMGQFGRIISLADLPDAADFEALVAAAAARIEAGEVPKRAAKPARPEAEVPAELADALAEDAAAGAAFADFPPGARRDYCEWIAEAKRPETKAKRVADAVAWLREGKRRNWKHETPKG